MPVSLLLGLPGNESIEDTYFSWLTRPGVGITNGEDNKRTKRPVLTPAQLVYIGLRDVDAGERAILRQNGIKAFSMHEVDKFGIGTVVEMALDHVNPNRDLPIHLSFDVDALDPSVAPSTGTPVSNQLLLECSYLMAMFSLSDDRSEEVLRFERDITSAKLYTRPDF
jgi:arginase